MPVFNRTQTTPWEGAPGASSLSAVELFLELLPAKIPRGHADEYRQLLGLQKTTPHRQNTYDLIRKLRLSCQFRLSGDVLFREPVQGNYHFTEMANPDFRKTGNAEDLFLDFFDRGETLAYATTDLSLQQISSNRQSQWPSANSDGSYPRYVDSWTSVVMRLPHEAAPEAQDVASKIWDLGIPDLYNVPAPPDVSQIGHHHSVFRPLSSGFCFFGSRDRPSRNGGLQSRLVIDFDSGHAYDGNHRDATLWIWQNSSAGIMW